MWHKDEGEGGRGGLRSGGEVEPQNMRIGRIGRMGGWVRLGEGGQRHDR